MDNILNRKGIEDYSKRFAAKVMGSHFDKSDSINGEEIKSICSIKQVNLFVIKALFEEWQKELDNLKSPYFNYEAEEVQTALSSFMNILSKNILIKQEHFQSLLERAVKESILLIFSPFDFYDHLTEHYHAEISAENLLKVIRYVKINENILHAVIKKLEAQTQSKVDIATYRTLLTEVLHEIESGPEEIDEYYDAFNNIEVLNETDIYGITAASEEIPIVSTNDDEQEEPLLKETVPSINEVLSNDEPTIADAHKNTSIDSLLTALSINQRFMFQNTLFNGDEELMSGTLSYLDKCDSKKQAMDYIYQEFPHWNIEGEEFEEFIELLGRKFD